MKNERLRLAVFCFSHASSLTLSFRLNATKTPQWRLAARSMAPADADAEMAGAGRRRQSMYKPETSMQGRRQSTYGAQMAGGGLLPQW